MEIFPDRLWEYLNAATGAEYSMEELLKSGERIFNAERIFLVKAGFRKQDDSLPARLTKEPLPQGPTRGKVVHLDEMLAEYYKERGWDEEGVPTLTKLRELGLD
ncbi:MAG: aldehyde ferredoxin oxidoreductase C-terminal domain-containing protein [Thermodesulfobacteriota bacterium]